MKKTIATLAALVAILMLVSCPQKSGATPPEPPKPKTYTVRFISNDAEGEMAPQIFTENVPQAINKCMFTKEGYTFKHWDSNEGKIYQNQETIYMSKDLTLYAQWDTDTYLVFFNANWGEGRMQSQTFSHGVPQKLAKSSFTRVGYSFDGWATSSNGEKIYEDEDSIAITNHIELYAVWKPNTYTVTFDANGGSGTMEPQTFTHGKSQPLSYLGFTRDGYIFKGWATTPDGKVEYYKTNTPILITRDMTLYAVWEIKEYYVIFFANGGTGQMTSKHYQHDIPDSLPKNTFTRAGYTFIGWATSSDGQIAYSDEAIISIKNNMSLYAIWEKDIYTVVFDANGGIGTMPSQSFTYGKPQLLNKNKFTHENHWFKGWATSPDGKKVYRDQEQVSVSSNMTLYAVWELYHTITFDTNGGTGTMQPQQCGHGKPTKLTKCTFKRDGYTFEGWHTNPDSQQSIYGNEKEITLTEDITLYAIWRPQRYVVTFDAKSGTGSMILQIFYHDRPQAISKNLFTNDDAIFVGWATEFKGEKVYDDEEIITVTSDLTLYAVWGCTVTFYANPYDPNDKESMPPQIFTHGKPQKLNKYSFPLEDLTFVGWEAYYVREDGSLYKSGFWLDEQVLGIYGDYILKGTWEPKQQP